MACLPALRPSASALFGFCASWLLRSSASALFGFRASWLLRSSAGARNTDIYPVMGKRPCAERARRPASPPALPRGNRRCGPCGGRLLAPGSPGSPSRPRGQWLSSPGTSLPLQWRGRTGFAPVSVAPARHMNCEAEPIRKFPDLQPPAPRPTGRRARRGGRDSARRPGRPVARARRTRGQGQ